MVILERVERADLALYRSIVRSMPFAVEPCGFLPAHTRADDINYVRLGVNNLYHALVHGLVYDEPAEVAQALPFHAKGVFFLQQMLHLLRTGDFCPNRAALMNALPGASAPCRFWRAFADPATHDKRSEYK